MKTRQNARQNARILARKERALAHAERQISRMSWGTQPREVANWDGWNPELKDRRETIWYKCGNLKMEVVYLRNSR